MFNAIFQKDHNIRYKDYGVDILDAFRLSLQFLQEDKVMTKINSKECKFVGDTAQFTYALNVE